MILWVPFKKGSDFASDLFGALQWALEELRMETGKWPDQTELSGPLGLEVYEYVTQANWDLKHFGFKFTTQLSDRIRCSYSKSIDQIEDRTDTIFDSPLHDKTIQGIPGPETIRKITAATVPSRFKIERQIRPHSEIRLRRKR